MSDEHGRDEVANAADSAGDETVPAESAFDAQDIEIEDAEAAMESEGGAVHELSSVEAIFDQVTKERDEYLDTLRRLQADFENFRKRTARQQSELSDRASLSLLERLLPVLDAFDLAMRHVENADTESTISEGSDALGQVAGLLRNILEKEGLERIDQVDVAFDPTIHDAVAHVDVPDIDTSVMGEGKGPEVAEVMRSGYLLNGRVLRPAMVAVRG